MCMKVVFYMFVSILTLYNIHALLIYFTIDFQPMAVYQVKSPCLETPLYGSAT